MNSVPTQTTKPKSGRYFLFILETLKRRLVGISEITWGKLLQSALLPLPAFLCNLCFDATPKSCILRINTICLIHNFFGCCFIQPNTPSLSLSAHCHPKYFLPFATQTSLFFYRHRSALPIKDMYRIHNLHYKRIPKQTVVLSSRKLSFIFTS